MRLSAARHTSDSEAHRLQRRAEGVWSTLCGAVGSVLSYLRKEAPAKVVSERGLPLERRRRVQPLGLTILDCDSQHLATAVPSFETRVIVTPGTVTRPLERVGKTSPLFATSDQYQYDNQALNGAFLHRSRRSLLPVPTTRSSQASRSTLSMSSDAASVRRSPALRPSKRSRRRREHRQVSGLQRSSRIAPAVLPFRGRVPRVHVIHAREPHRQCAPRCRGPSALPSRRSSSRHEMRKAAARNGVMMPRSKLVLSYRCLQAVQKTQLELTLHLHHS